MKKRFIERVNKSQARLDQQISESLKLEKEWLDGKFTKPETMLFKDPKLKLDFGNFELKGKKLSQKETANRVESAIRICKLYVDELIKVTFEEDMPKQLVIIYGIDNINIMNRQMES